MKHSICDDLEYVVLRGDVLFDTAFDLIASNKVPVVPFTGTTIWSTVIIKDNKNMVQVVCTSPFS